MDQKKIKKAQLNRYLKAREAVEDYLGFQSPSLKTYYKVYDRQILGYEKVKVIGAKPFFKQLRSSDIILVGDFHAEAQSVRSFMRICRSIGHHDIVLGLECISVESQKILEKYLKGELSEELFLKKVKWNERWGFPFSLYKPLFDWAIQYKVQVYGFNFDLSSLKKRDQKIARFIAQLKSKYPQKQIMVQIGDKHLAQKHLPMQLKKMVPRATVQIVHQSPEALFFHTQLNRQKNYPDFLKLSDNNWAVLSVVPWIKWENYLMNLERSADREAEDLESMDLMTPVTQSFNFLCELTHEKLNQDDFEVSANLNRISSFKNNYKIAERKMIKELMEENFNMALPEIRHVFVSQAHANSISEAAAMVYLMQKKILTKSFFLSKNYFLQNIWIEMLIYFLAKLSNPKRKSETFLDVRSILKDGQSVGLGKTALLIALEQKLSEMKFLEKGMNTYRVEKRSKSSRSDKHFYLASRVLGRMLGEKVFLAITNKLVSWENLKKVVFVKNLESELFYKQYFNQIEIIESWPIPVKSKFDQF